MIAAILLCILASPTGAYHSVPVTVLQDDAEVESAIQAAGENIAKLMKLATRYSDTSNSAAADKVYRRVIELDPDHKAARTGLRHQHYDDQWFESFVALAKYKRKEAARMKSKGLALHSDQWVPIDDIPFLKMGWDKDTSGVWVDPVEAARAKEVAVLESEGCQFRADDNSWVAPDEFENWTNLLWKCGDDWLGLEEADKYHSKVGQQWELMGEHFVTWTTAAWGTGNLARWHADQTHAHLLKIFGVEPKDKPHFFVVPSLAAYNDAAGGASTHPDSEGYSSLHGAYYSDICFDTEVEPQRFIGMGVSYWDRSDEALGPWGPFWARWAAAQSYMDAIDRSWHTIGDWVSDGPRGNQAVFGPAFWKEKRIPRWLRYGSASYVERYLPNPEAAADADPWGLRAFAFAELKKTGGLRPLAEVFAFGLTQDDLPGSSRLYHEAGLLVAFIMDGAADDAALGEAHQAFKTALTSGSKEEALSAVKTLEAALLTKDKEIRAFAGL